MPEICLSGTGGMMPLKDRYVTNLYYELEGRAVLIDCGEGTQVALTAAGIKLSRIETILITHSHADHIAGLPGLLLSIGNCARTEPLRIYFPAYCERALKNLLFICGRLPFRVEFFPLSTKEASQLTLDNIDPMLTLRTLVLRHRVECLGYSLTLYKKPVFQPERAQELGIPVQYWRRLHGGETVTLEDGRTIDSTQVTGGIRPPVKVTYVTDTLPIPEIAGFAEGSDLFVCEGMYGEEDKKESMNDKHHMLMQDACRLAQRAGVKRLWLTHYSPAEKHPERFAKELREIFPETLIPKDGQTITL